MGVICSSYFYTAPKGQKKGFRYYLAGLLGESKRKNIDQMTNNIIGASPWDEQLINERC